MLTPIFGRHFSIFAAEIFSLKQFWNILVLLIFVNFTALPGIAVLAGFEIPQTNVVITEEDNHSSQTFVVYEKAIPRVLDVHDFIKFTDPPVDLAIYLFLNEALTVSPYFSINSPPPEA